MSNVLPSEIQSYLGDNNLKTYLIFQLNVKRMPSHEPDELRRMHETIDTYYPRTYLDCWAAV